jgi:hypothetical protein
MQLDFLSPNGKEIARFTFDFDAGLIDAVGVVRQPQVMTNSFL